MDNFQLKHSDFIPPCGIYCGACPNFTREKNKCDGFENACKARKCKGIYVCCVEKKRLEFCYQCKTFPCSRYKKFADRWLKHGQDLLKNQALIKTLGKEEFRKQMTKSPIQPKQDK